MRYVYPVSHDLAALSKEQLVVRIARHSNCTRCLLCPGLRPPQDANVFPDDEDLGDLMLDDAETLPYLDICICGHSAVDHGASETELGALEFARRGRVATRCDELLKDTGNLLDFGYTNADITSLRKQMRLFDANNGHSEEPEERMDTDEDDEDAPIRRKRRRIYSSDDEEDNSPPTQRLAPHQKGGGKMHARHQAANLPSKTTSSRTGPLSTAAAQEKLANDISGANEHRIKPEDKMDDIQLNRLATGIPIDSTNNVAPVRTEKIVNVELRKGVIKIMPVEHDKQPRSWVLLTGLKTLFQKQLPKMPREYIARLVYDPNSAAMAIVKRGFKVVGGILYRPFVQRGFAEIVFFATNSTDQVKGYGGTLMDHFKSHVRVKYPEMKHFLTYADNYAVGYFEKQGFAKDITLDRSIWAGYIKDYEGANLMQCALIDKVDYLDKTNILSIQQEAVYSKIRQLSRSHIVHPGLPMFQEGMPEGTVADYRDVPGLRDSGWTPEMDDMVRAAPRNTEQGFMEQLLRDLQSHAAAWPFMDPVKVEDVRDYHDVVKQPMGPPKMLLLPLRIAYLPPDLRTMEQKLENGHYLTIDGFVADAQLIFDNCRLYNPPTTVYYKMANQLEKYFKRKVDQRPE
ncbi:hypothetical protein CYLTODRAFT_439343 [Cylindrobasidium torrendii FP15055 ss-10]|uniref:Uncharacterized protein n=1 Tax=Cylindrobasidium torrendii FP15055 ss-10 TaxID=1314674 RepID=A0A0D7BVC3_9AGAR|nr:hypothetical protein CYLTODRAFT_439343 [Cylindrobasidium torrendii FP15055 ss-10]